MATRSAHRTASKCIVDGCRSGDGHLLAQFAQGSASDLVSTMYLQAECPVLLAPAMSNVMWSKSPVQRNVNQLKADGCHFVGPDEGWLSCRQSGAGRMSEPDDILNAIQRLIGQT